MPCSKPDVNCLAVCSNDSQKARKTASLALWASVWSRASLLADSRIETGERSAVLVEPGRSETLSGCAPSVTAALVAPLRGEDGDRASCRGAEDESIGRASAWKLFRSCVARVSVGLDEVAYECPGHGQHAGRRQMPWPRPRLAQSAASMISKALVKRVGI